MRIVAVRRRRAGKERCRAGNDQDDDPVRYEPHYDEIASAGKVQIYESMADSSGTPTAGLLRGIAFVKDNRLLPGGFDKRATSIWRSVEARPRTTPSSAAAIA
jgi:hypothetical protein